MDPEAIKALKLPQGKNRQERRRRVKTRIRVINKRKKAQRRK